MKQLTDLKRRFVISMILLSIVTALIAFSFVPFVSFLAATMIALLAGIGVWEYAQLVRAKELEPAVHLMVVVAVTQVFAFFLNLRFLHWPLLPIAVAGMGLLAFFVTHFNNSTNALLHVAVEFFSVSYIAVPLSFLFGILYPEALNGVEQDGRWWLVYLITVTKVTDVGAYFIGRIWGKHKLAPHLSPKKTVEGALGGFVCALAVSIGIAHLGQTFSHGSFDLTFVQSIWLGVILSIAGQIGDLSESLLKRDAFVKDSNKLPGLGGVLDMLDSLLVTAPILYLFLKVR
jgi:phosphatidate cytidylyltransferase